MKKDDRFLRRMAKRRGDRGCFREVVSWILLFAITVPLFSEGVTVMAENGICPHHRQHTAECGYQEAAAEKPCGHEHDETCGKIDSVTKSVCTHQHDEACGYREAEESVPCSHEHDEACGGMEEEASCAHRHDEECGYQEASEGIPCGHQHDESCGYAVSGTEASGTEAVCTHEHDEACGYAEASEEAPCKFVCEICGAKTKDDSLTVVAWSWNSEYLVWNEDAGQWGLGLPGAKEEEPVTAEVLMDFLPKEIEAQRKDGTAETLPLTWDFGGLPKEGACAGSYTLTAALPKNYVLGDAAKALTVVLELGGGEAYAVTDKFVNAWSYESRGGSEITEDTEKPNYEYAMDYYLAVTSDRAALIEKLNTILPNRILCEGYNTGYVLEMAGFTPAEGQSGTGNIKGYVKIEWQNVEEAVNSAAEIGDNASLTFYAAPVSNPGYRIRVNSRNGALPESNNDTAERGDILNLTVTLHDLHLEEHTVPSVNPPNTTVNLFDYWVDTSGADGDDLLPKTDPHRNPSAGTTPDRTGVSDWNRGINEGRLLLFGDGNIHAGFWNKGAGSGSDYGKQAAGMPGIVKPLLEGGYPVIDTAAMEKQIDGYAGISDWKLCGDHKGDPDNVEYDSINPKNISDSVKNIWLNSGNSASLDYLFDLGETDNKRSYEDVRGLFQLDSNGYYYYDMRQNFAEYSHDRKEFILYDAPAVERTDANYQSSARSVGNFLPFNTGAQVFDLIKDGKLDGNMNISSNNLNTTAGYVNHHLGMTVSIDFLQPLGGMTNTGANGSTPMTFQFSGDDDVWIFIDDVLVLDLGGIHSEIYGTIDFRTGAISVGQSWKTNGFPYKSDGTVDIDKLYQTAPPVFATNLKAQFEKVGKAGEARGWNGNTFASNTSHTLKMFYLERGNYDSSLALRFNLQPLLYQQIKKVDQNGSPLSGVEFDLCPAEETTKDASGAIRCLYTDREVHGGNEFYVRQAEGSSFIHLKTASDGTARFLDEDGHFFNFADRGNQYYILKEKKTPAGYRTLPIDVVLYYDSDTSMLSVANRWTTGSYACSVANIVGTGRLNYSRYNEGTGEVDMLPELFVSQAKQKDGIIAVVPMIKRRSDHTWRALYGSNLSGFCIPDSSDGSWEDDVLRAVLEQAANGVGTNWYLSWDADMLHLVETISDLPGLADRYLSNNPDGDMRMVFGIIEPEALEQMGIIDADRADDPAERYEALGRYVRTYGVDQALLEIQKVQTAGTGSNSGFSLINDGQFTKTFRSLIYIPNDQRELWAMKVDQDGKPRNGARFGLYTSPDCTGTPIAEGETAEVNGQKGTLVFSSDDDESPGHAKMPWAAYENTHYYLKELSAPEGCQLNETVISVVIGTRSIYADAGTKEDGVTVMAGVGRLTQTMRQYAMNDDVDITLRDITAVGQSQPSANTDVSAGDWKDMKLSQTDVLRTMNLHYGKNAVIDYGLHDEDGGALYKPYFVSDSGFVRARVMQNYKALEGLVYEGEKLDANKDNLGGTDITNLFGLLNIVVVTDQTKEETNTGTLAISKRLVGPDLQESDYTKNFTFTVRLTDATGQELAGSYYFYGTDKSGYISSGMKLPLHHDEQIIVLGLPAGSKFSVVETEEDGWYVFPKTGEISGEIVKDTASQAGFLNSKEPWPAGSLIIRKTVAGSGDTEKEFTFTVNFTDENGETLNGTYFYTGDKSGSIASGGSVTLSHGQHIMIEGLPAGTGYTVTENEANQDGYATIANGNVGTITDSGTSAAVFTNYREAPPGTGSLIIRKTVTGSGDTEREFTFLVTFTDKENRPLEGEFLYSGNKEGKIKSGGSVTLGHGQHIMIEGLPVGTHYTVTEREANQEGYVTSAEGDTGITEENKTITAVFTNDRETESPTGSLIIRKTVTGSGDTAKEFMFTVALSDENGTPLEGEFHYTGDKTGSISNGQSVALGHGQHIMIEGLPSGTHYAVTEREANQDGYQTSASGETGVVQQDVTYTASFVNDRKSSKGSLIIQKTVTGGGDTEREFTFTVLLSQPNGEPLEGEFPYFGDKSGSIASGQSVRLKHGQHVMIADLPAGTAYIVMEQEADQDGYVTSASGAEGAVEENETHTASFTNVRNMRPMTSSLIIRKTVAGSGDMEKEFTFTVTLAQANGEALEEAFHYSGDKSGSIASGQSVKLKHGQHIMIEDLPVGVKYTVTEQEANQNGYVTSMNGETGTVMDHETHTASFVNYKALEPALGSLIIRKTVTGGGDTEREFTFALLLMQKDGSPLEGAFPYIGDKKGSIASGQSVTLKHGQHIMITELPVGAQYVVAEQEANQDGYATIFSGESGSIGENGTYTAEFINNWNFGMPSERKEPVDFSDLKLQTVSDLMTSNDFGLGTAGTGRKTLPMNTPYTGENIAFQDLMYLICLASFVLLFLVYGEKKGNK